MAWFNKKRKDSAFLPENPTDRQLEVDAILRKALKKHRKNPEIDRPGAISRSSIQLDQLSDGDLLNAGFKKSYIAVPETGQSQLVTYRHPRSNLHFHKHPKNWLFHEDKYPALSMVMEKFKQYYPNASLAQKADFFLSRALPESASHIIHEGLPGWTNWISNTLEGAKGFNSSDTSTNYGEAAKRIALGAGALSAMQFALSGGDKKLETLPGNFAGLSSFVGGQRLATALYQKLTEKHEKFRQPNPVATALLVGLPAVTAIAGKVGTDKIVNMLLNKKDNTYA